jgi:hypothetical protein
VKLLRVKIFTSSKGIQSLENNVNDFAKDRKIIGIHQTQSKNGDKVNVTITAMYEE